MPTIQRKRNTIILIGATLLVLGVVAFLFLEKKEVEPQLTITNEVSDVRCYGSREMTNNGEYNYNLVAIDFYRDNKIQAIFDYKDNTLESSGILEGTYSRTDNQITGVYDFYTNNDLYLEERLIRFNESGLEFGFGEMYTDDDGVMRYHEDSPIHFDYPLPLITCQRYGLWKQEYEKIANTTGIITTE